jgi:tRNA-binding protein
MSSVTSTFNAVNFSIAKIIAVEPNKHAKIPAFLLKLDLGKMLIEEHQSLFSKSFYVSSAQLCSRYSSDDLIGKSVLCVINFPRKQIGKNMSDCLVTGVQKPELSFEEKTRTTTVVVPSVDVEPGSKVTVSGEETEVFVSNPRNLSWDKFTSLDLRVATILSYDYVEKNVEKLHEKIHIFALNIKFKDSTSKGIAYLDKNFCPDNLIKKQYLFYYYNESNLYYLCSIAGRSFLTPSLPVEDGFKLA